MTDYCCVQLMAAVEGWIEPFTWEEGQLRVMLFNPTLKGKVSKVKRQRWALEYCPFCGERVGGE
jgi:hypothetical protein